MRNDGGIRFSLDELAAAVEDLMRVGDELNPSGDEVNAHLLDLVVNRLLTSTVRVARNRKLAQRFILGG